MQSPQALPLLYPRPLWYRGETISDRYFLGGTAFGLGVIVLDAPLTAPKKRSLVRCQK